MVLCDHVGVPVLHQAMVCPGGRSGNRSTGSRGSQTQKVGLESDGTEELMMPECDCLGDRREHPAEVELVKMCQQPLSHTGGLHQNTRVNAVTRR